MIEYLRQAAKKYPQKPALVDADTGDAWSYRELFTWAEAIASTLAETGIEPGDRVGLISRRNPEAVATIWAIWGVGGVVVPHDPTESKPAIRSKCDRADLALCVTDTADSGGTSHITPENVPTIDMGTGFDRGTESPMGLQKTPPRRGIDQSRTILFTSGTTGTPTGVLLTGRNLGASAASTVERLNANQDDRWLLDLPLYHAGGLSIPIRTAMLGATTYLRHSFDASGMARTIDEHGITGVSLVPTMLDRLLAADGGFETLRFALSGGAATPSDLAQRALDAGIPVYPSYGMTETASGIATATPEEVRTDPETVGRPVRAASISIEDPAGETLEPGQTGEIVVSGPIVSPGSIDGAGTTYDTARQPRNRLRTGDRGYHSESGHLYVTGRIDGLIVTGGENVSPREVETALREEWPVSDVAVIGLPDDEWGERVAAAIVLAAETEAFDSARRKERLGDRLAPYKIPKSVRILEEIPRTASGTVDRDRLRDLLTGSASEAR